MADVFLSHSSEDGTTALRLYNDLRHARLDPWRYEADGRLGARFDHEFEAALAGSRVVCLLDSPAARRSPYVARECRLCRRLQEEHGRPRLLVCVLERRGRPEEPGWWGNEPFPGLNHLSFVDLTDYDNGVRQLCRELGAVYVPGFSLPRDRDVERELFAAGLEAATTQELIDAYTAFRCRYQVDPPLARAYLRVLIGRCRELGADGALSPHLALGVMLAEAGNHQRAGQVFSGVVERAPDDPRGWMGLAGARYFLGETEGALQAYRRCEALIGPPRDEVELLRVAELTHNVARCLAVLGDLPAARERLAALTAEQRQQPFVVALEGSLLLMSGDAAGARAPLEAARRGHGDEAPLPLLLDLADCYAALGATAEERRVIEHALARPQLAAAPELQRRAAALHERMGDAEGAVEALRRAAERTPGDPVYRSELASMLWQGGWRREARREAERALDDNLTPRQRYYRGLALYLLGRREEAALQERRSRQESAVVRAWPRYREVLGD